MERIHLRIKNARMAKKLSQKELAKLVGMDQGNLSRIENGALRVSSDMLGTFAKALGISINDLLGETESLPEYGSKHPAYKILKSDKAPKGLKNLANDRALVNALNITEDEWKALSSIKLSGKVSKDGYVQLLITIRAIS